MRRVTTKEFDMLVQDKDDTFAAIGVYFKSHILPQLLEAKIPMIKQRQKLLYDCYLKTTDVWDDEMQCAAVITCWWDDDDHPALSVNHFLIFNDEEEMMKHFGSAKMNELDLPQINPN